MKRPGFTLVELLVVISIIGMLMALLLPAVQQARAGRRNTCANNLRNVGMALLGETEVRGRFPATGYFGANGIYCRRPLAAFRVHAASQTRTRPNLADDMKRQQTAVLARHLPEWEAATPYGRTLGRVARFSANVNVALAKFAGGHRLLWFPSAAQFAAIGPAGWPRYFRDSRIVERCISRLQLRSARACGPRHLPSTSRDGSIHLHPPADRPVTAAWAAIGEMLKK